MIVFAAFVSFRDGNRTSATFRIGFFYNSSISDVARCLVSFSQPGDGTFLTFVTFIVLCITFFAFNILFSLLIFINRSRNPEVFLEKDVLKICCKFAGEHPCRNFIEITVRHVCSPVNFLLIFRIISRRMLLY